ncbi:MAG: hypothetical protein G01um101425_852 [Candidatus Peregrinibacteria bacterium Gr01-1014_25]|nr:MAG: hypothetical protein G01um101425_852 [Candidatus Peregrinibacteria bacterium Gr01-1014_25]
MPYGPEYQRPPEQLYGMHPQEWQQQTLMRMRQSMPAVRGHLQGWPQVSPWGGQMDAMNAQQWQQAPWLSPHQLQTGPWPAASPSMPTGPAWVHPDQQFFLQSFDSQTRAYGAHYPGGPWHHIENLRRMPPQHQMQYLRYLQEFQPAPPAPFLRNEPPPYARIPAWYGPTLSMRGAPYIPITVPPYMEYRSGQQFGQSNWISNAPPFINAGYGIRTRPDPFQYAPSTMPGYAPSHGLDGRRMGGMGVRNTLGRLSVDGRPIDARGVTGTFPQRYDIPTARLPEHGNRLQRMSMRLEQGIRMAGWPQPRVTSDGLRIWAELPSGEVMVATGTQLLVGRGKPGRGTWQSVETRTPVQWTETAKGDEFRIGGTRIVELRDGRIVREQYSGGSVPDVTMYYDHGTDAPQIIRVNGRGASVPLGVNGGQAVQLPHGMHVVGDRGGVASLSARPRSLEHAHMFLNDAGSRLRTPEAVGAFVSSYFTVEDTVARGGRRIASASTMDFKSESSGQQYIQSPEESIVRGYGDCEDFAVLASALCDRIGVPNIVVRKSSVHYVCAFLERTPQGGYALCTIDTGGFSRDSRVFRSGAEAMMSLWSGGGRSGISWELQNPRGLPPQLVAKGRAMEQSGGLSVLATRGISGGRAQMDFIPFHGYNWDQIVYRR